MKDVEIVATGPELISQGYRAIEPAIEEMLRGAQGWIHIMSFVFRPSAMNILDNGADDASGCTALFIYYMFTQLGFSINQIVGAGASTLAGVYRKLTSHTDDPFPPFTRLLDDAFPSETNSDNAAASYPVFHSFILLDEVDLFSNRTAANARDISKRYIARSKPYLVIISTPNVPDGLDYSLHGRATERQAI